MHLYIHHYQSCVIHFHLTLNLAYQVAFLSENPHCNGRPHCLWWVQTVEDVHDPPASEKETSTIGGNSPEKNLASKNIFRYGTVNSGTEHLERTKLGQWDKRPMKLVDFCCIDPKLVKFGLPQVWISSNGGHFLRGSRHAPVVYWTCSSLPLIHPSSQFSDVGNNATAMQLEQSI